MQISRWKLQLREQAAQIFAEPAWGAALVAPDLEPLYPAIGKLQIENQRLKKCSGHDLHRATGAGASQRRRQRRSVLPSRRPARGSYYCPRGESALNLLLMRLLNQEYTQHSFKGVLGTRNYLRLQGHPVNEKRVRRLLHLMGLEEVYPKLHLSLLGEGATCYPYVLRERVITAPNEVWSTDITYILMARGFLYLVAVLDWHSRYVLRWEFSNTLDVSFVSRPCTRP